ncbi:MAG TPA: FecR domain-containing protein [Gemmatimonadales bacterium]
MHLDDDRLYLLLDRYLAGEASAADAQAVRDWLAADPEHALLLNDLRRIRRVAAERVPESSGDAAWAKAVKALGVAPRPRLGRHLLVPALAVAATVIALIGGRGLLRRPPQWRVYATTAGQRLVMRLGDGTQVTLAPQSRLRSEADYGTERRDLYLDGEAYFQVAPDSQRPLRVHTTQSVTEDLGTAFVVRAYADQVATEVVVAEGRVTLSRADTTAAARTPALVLEARDLGTLAPSGVPALRRGVDVGRYIAWTRGVLAFDATPLGDVVRTLGRWYNVEIRLADSTLAARRLTATFQNESIDLVLQRIALTVGLRVERADGFVLLLRNGR